MQIETYLDADGRCPFDDWFQGLDLLAGARVARVLTRMALGNFADIKSVGGGVLESRIAFGPGYRVYFGRDGDDLILLLAGGTKRRQQSDIDAATTRWMDFKKRKKELARGGTDPKLQGKRESPRRTRAGISRRTPRGSD